MATQLLITEEDEQPQYAGEPSIIPTEDGGAIVDLEPQPEPGKAEALQTAEWDANLAEYLDDTQLMRIAGDLIDGVKSDDASRDEWKKILKDGMEQLGLENMPRDIPYKGACGVTYPLIMEAAVRFQARAIVEMFPEGGPVETKVVGEETDETREQSERVRDYLNYLLSDKDEGYFPDYDQMLLWLAIQGSMFRKVWRDPLRNMTSSRYIKSDDIVLSYGAADEVTAPRLTHLLRYTPNEVLKLQVAGFYRDIPLVKVTQEADPGPMAEKANEIEGVEAPTDDKHARRLLYEVHTELYLEDDPAADQNGIALPYVVTIDEESQVVLAIRRGWRQNDPERKRREYFVHYRFFPGFGVYGYGYAHLAAGHNRAITSILRQLVDAGQFANLPAGVITKGALKKDQNNVPFAPGEFKELDNVAPERPISNLISPLPFKEPSAVLFQMMNGLIESGQRLTNLMDAEVGDGSTQQAVGTVVALLEQSLQVQSAIHKRMHRAQHKEFRLIAETEREFIPPEGYPYNVGGTDRKVMQQDFDDRVDVIPVSDPKAFTTTQRMAKAQFVFQTAQTAPQLHKAHGVYKYMYDAAGIDNTDAFLAQEPPPPYTGDPNSENMAVMQGKQLQARPDQDHESHCTAHLLMLQIPGMMMSPPGQILFKHAVEHELLGIWSTEQQAITQTTAANPALRQAQAMGAQIQPIQLPPPGQPMPPELENAYAKATATAMQRVVAKLKAMVPMPPGQTDPAMIQAQTNAEDVKMKDSRERMKIAEDAKAKAEATALAARKHADEMALEYEKLTADVTSEQMALEQAAREGAMGRLTTLATRPQQQPQRPMQ
jgi:hypothetical protein